MTNVAANVNTDSLTHQEELAKLHSSFAINNTLKKQGIGKTMNDQLDIIAASELKDVAAATASKVVPTKKQLKQQKYAKKNMMAQLRDIQRKGQSQHIMSKLGTHVHHTPEQIIQLRAGNAAHEELSLILGPRQAEAFFAAKSDTLTTDFFPAATIHANPTLMLAKDGSARTLAQVYEYYIYKHYMLLTKETTADVPALGLSEDWSAAPVAEYQAIEVAEAAQFDVV